MSGVCVCTRPVDLDYTDEMVLDNFVRGLADEETKTKVFALREDNWTAENVLKLVKAEELGKSSVRDSKRLNDIQAVSAYRRIQRNDPTTPVYTPSPSTSHWQCWSCDQGHAREAVCPAKKLKCTLCNKKGHMTSKCYRQHLRTPQNSKGGQNLAPAEEVT